MLKRLFLREFRAGLGVYLAILLGLLAMFTAVSRKNELEVAAFLQWFTGPMFVVLGFGFGERCFPERFKEQHIVFLDAIPVTRRKLWATIVTARFLACSPALLPILYVIRYSLRKFALTGEGVHVTILNTPGSWTSLLALFALSFIAGGAWSLLFRRSVFVYCIGLVITGLALYGVRIFVGYCAFDPAGRIGAIDLAVLSRDWLSVLCILLVVGTILSVWIFTRADFFSSRRCLANLVGAAVILGTCSLGIIAFFVSLGIASIVSDWEPFPYQFGFGGYEFSLLEPAVGSFRGLVSAGGRQIVVPEYLKIRPWLARVSVVDTDSGSVIFHRNCQGLVHVGWSATGERLQIIVINRSPFRLPLADLFGPRRIAVKKLEVDMEKRTVSGRPGVVGLFPSRKGVPIIEQSAHASLGKIVVDFEVDHAVEYVKVDYSSDLLSPSGEREVIRSRDQEFRISRENKPDVVSIDFGSGVTAIGARQGGGMLLYVFDPKLSRLFERDMPTCKGWIRSLVGPMTGVEGLLIQAWCAEEAEKIVLRLFRYVPGSGRIEAVGRMQGRSLEDIDHVVYVGADEKVIWISAQGRVMVSSKKGVKVLWQPAQGGLWEWPGVGPYEWLGGGSRTAMRNMVEQKGFEPSTPTLRTWCSPS
jgi:hypothetical protein